MSRGLEVAGLTVDFGGVRALDDVDLRIEPGQLVGLIGPNGARKNNLIYALTGFVPALGSLSFAGHDLKRLAPHRRARLGLGRTWQSLELFDDLTVAENLEVAGPAVEAALDAVDLTFLADRLPTELSQGQRKLVGVARALAANPTVVCLDEPAAGLDRDESTVLGGRLRRLVDRGLGLLLVDHDMGLVLEVCDRVVVLQFGRVLAAGDPGSIRTDDRVITAYLGASR